MGSASTPQPAVPFEARLPCPVCLGVPMEKVALGRPGKILTLDHCARCGGIWFEKGETQRLTLHAPAELWKLVPPRVLVFRPPCHGCGTPLARESETCGVCARENELACPSCDRRTKRQSVDGITIDICEKCKGAWFDHVELRHIWKIKFTEISRRTASVESGDLLLDSFLWIPDFSGANVSVSGLGDAASATGDGAISGAVEATPEVLGVVGDAASSVFDAIADILGGLFD